MKYSDELQQLIIKTGATGQPVIVPIQIEQNAIPLQCFNNVKNKVKREGGNMLYGWAVWGGELLIEAELHTVWQDQNGNLIDITPHDNYLDDIILFLPHPEYVYNGELVDNLRLNITGNPLVDDFIKISEFSTRIKSTGTKVGNDYMLEGSMAKLAYIIAEWRINLETFILKGKKLNDQCFCGLSYSYKDCHGHDMDQNLNMFFQQAQN